MDRMIEAFRWRGYKLKDQGWGRTCAGRQLVDLLLLPNDIHLIRSHYSRVFGRNPRLFFPRTFNEKIQRSKLIHRRQRHIIFADKLAVREYVRERVGDKVLIPLLWSGHDLREARSACLPGPFVIKATHGQGSNIFVQNSDEYDWDTAIEKARVWKLRHYDAFAAEWQYRWVPPCVLIEAALPQPVGGSLLDYKFFCFHGRVAFVQLDVDRHTNHTRAILDRDFNRLEVGLHYPRYHGPVRRPDCYAGMVQVAERLSRGEPFIRVDMYECGRPMFGELTIHPGAGLELFDPREWDRIFGECW